MNIQGEFELIEWIRSRRQPNESVLIGPGDDCAFVQTGAQQLLITTDMLMDGVDFQLANVDAKQVGRKCLAVNLSDIAAMAGAPRFAVVSVALPRGPGTGALARDLHLGMEELAAEFSVAIVGGDTNTWDYPLVVSVTLLGEAGPGGVVTRSGARSGDWLFVTGPLGGSIRGHHLSFTPRVREALALAAEVKLKAMIDISDGLAADLNHLLEASGCGAVLDAAAIPKNTTLEAALGDGEDFELLFAVVPEDGRRLLGRPGLWKIGECIDAGMWIEQAGTRRPLPPLGWRHPFERDVTS